MLRPFFLAILNDRVSTGSTVNSPPPIGYRNERNRWRFFVYTCCRILGSLNQIGSVSVRFGYISTSNNIDIRWRSRRTKNEKDTGHRTQEKMNANAKTRSNINTRDRPDRNKENMPPKVWNSHNFRDRSQWHDRAR